MLAFISLLGAAMSWLNWIEAINGFAWGPPMLILLAGTGLFLTLGLRFMPQRNIAYAFKMMWRGGHPSVRLVGGICGVNLLKSTTSFTRLDERISEGTLVFHYLLPGELVCLWV